MYCEQVPGFSCCTAPCLCESFITAERKVFNSPVRRDERIRGQYEQFQVGYSVYNSM